MSKSPVKKSLIDAYRFNGFTTKSKIYGHFCVSKALVITLVRRQKKQFADVVARFITLGMIIEQNWRETFRQAIIKFILNLKYVEYFAENVRP